MKPNVSLPLASSYNTRGLIAYENVFTSALDQRKINSMYEPVTNSLTGKSTLYLCKRFGASLGSDTYGTSGQVAYQVIRKPGAASFTSANHWVFSTSGNDIRASDAAATTTVIATASGYVPTWVEITLISGTETLVVQLRNSSGAQTVWYATAIGTFTQITDADFTALTLRGKMQFLNGYAFVLTDTNKIYNSEPNSLSSWLATDFITKEIKQDVPRGLARLGNQIIAFGAQTMEVFVNVGNATGSPLVSDKDRAQDVGLNIFPHGSTNYYAVLGNKMYFHGTRGGNPGRGIFVYDGNTAERVSNNAIEKILTNITSSVTYSINSFTFAGQEAIAVGLDVTTAATQRWLMYFPKWNDWFEWNSTVFSPVNSKAGFYLGVGSNQHRLYQFGIDADYQDDTTDYTMTHQFALPSEDNDRKFMRWCGVKGDTARSASSLGVSFSDDDGQNWSTARNIDMTSDDKAITRCGAFKNRQVRLTHTGNIDVRLEKFLARVE